jgi:acetyltransferase-like isoleucine patch superfamily enzyme
MTDIPRAQDQLFDQRTSAREKYAALVVGRPGWGALIKHELVTLASQSTPGALGLALRQTLYPALLAGCGRNVVFGQNVVLRHPHKIRIGNDVVIDDNCLIDAKGDANRGITIGNGVFIGRNTILSCKNGDIDVSDGTNIGFNCEIFSASSVRVGRDVLIAAYCYLIGGDHDFSDPSQPVLAQGRRSAGVTVGDGAWLGAGAKILDGASIGDRAVVGAGAVVRDSVPAGAIAVGIPAKVIGLRPSTGSGQAPSTGSGQGPE